MWELQRFASQGIPDGAGIRSTVCKLLLGYLPPERGQWSSELAKKSSQYKYFKEELLMNPLRVSVIRLVALLNSNVDFQHHL
ncbi:hypothetical protein F3Y22_tig00001644pilonHSYRG00351 [Hibiscus syriacus]|uniref:Uncharacterized protein n=1 Tax=Hibiscus syriacus TaxID=106335 RepID=A0A6A3D0M6_HIBSY|nr:hypothetical protein F3Y22_tig00001644pilonHSYRG00351 [Hibiscus syriacus]